MQFRRFGRLDWQASALGFGCMRLPTTGEYKDIDEPLATRMLHCAIEQGVNYIDTAYGYHGGNSERFLGKALQGDYRQKVKLATKLPPWLVKEAEDIERILNEQLDKLQTEHIDLYLLHSLSRDQWRKLCDMNIYARLERFQADGRIGALGFSFHDKYEVFQEIVDSYDRWDFCQIQYNYMNEEEQAGTKGLLYAASKGLAVVVMEPLLGGRLVNPPAPVQALWDSAGIERTSAEWALRWLWNKAEVSVVLSGMSTMQQVTENVASAERSGVGVMSAQELALVEQVRAQYEELCPIPCTKCRYCMPCPHGVDIPRCFEVYNTGRMYNIAEQARTGYTHIPAEARADNCIACRECETKCPQHILISEWMPRVHAVLGDGQAYEQEPACPA